MNLSFISLASRMLMSSCRRRKTENGVELDILFDIGISCMSTEVHWLAEDWVTGF